MNQKRRHWLTVAGAVALVPATLVVVAAGPSNAATSSKFSATQVTSSSKVAGAKSTSRLAQTDPALLGRHDSQMVSIVVKLSGDSVATYAGGIPGFAATSPATTGHKLSGSAAEKKYANHLGDLETAFASQLAKKVPTATIGRSLRTVYGGIAAQVPANKVADVLSIPGVVAVQQDSLRQINTDSSPAFIGATSLYPGMGGTANAGSGVIFGVLDTGAWPEHPSYADLGNLGAPPPKADATARTCNFGDNPLTPAVDVFVCNHKVIGGAPFINTYNAVIGGEIYPSSARDSNGHGTHTGTTVAGDVVATANVLGVNRGPINGIAPGAWVSVYKVCGAAGCFSSDSAAAVAQAILDGVSVINFSISGGSSPFTDPVELAFLDAFAAGVLVSASAGNSGPTPSTTDHVSPWVDTVAASTQAREFDSTLTLTSGPDSLVLHGASITAGAGPLPVVLSSAAPYSNNLCTAPAAPGIFTGKIVACQRGGNARVDKGYNVAQGGASAMILYNATLADVETDNHWLPAVHLADGTSFKAFMTAHPGVGAVSASFTAGAKIFGSGDVMAAFSSRGPGGLFLKPDITAPGIEILAGMTPTPESITEGPAGQYFQAIAGTSMSSPHNAGAAVLVKSAHPSWTPAQIKSALMLTAKTSVVKEDLTTPADPFDFGGGRVDLTKASNPGLALNETAANMALLGNDPVHAVDLNLASVNAPVMPGKLTTTRVVKNVSSNSQTYHVTTSAPAGSSITVSPSLFTVAAGASKTLTITIKSSAPTGQYFGQVLLDPIRAGMPTLHMQVAWVPQQGNVNLSSSCTPTSITLLHTSVCTVTAVNNSSTSTQVNLRTDTDLRLPITGVSGGATQTGLFSATKNNVPLGGAHPGVPSIAAGSTPAGPGYLPLSLFGITPDPIGDEDILNYNVPAFVWNGVTYDAVGVDSNGYLVAGGGTSLDNECCNIPPIPNPARPNDIMAPFWTDMDGSSAAGIRAATLTDGVNTWLVIEWNVNVFGTASNRHFQVWIGLDGTQDVSFDYDDAALPANPNGQMFDVGCENSEGSGQGLHALPTQDQVCASTTPTPGGSTSYTVTVRGILPGTGSVTSSMTTPLVPGTTIVKSDVTVSLH